MRKLPSKVRSKSPINSGNSVPRVPEETIRRLSELLKSTDLAEIEIREGSQVVRVRAKESASHFSQPPNVTLPSAPPAPRIQKPIEPHSDLHIIRSPFIGTFYRSPSPQASAFVELNQTISKGEVLGIIEAMKLMNEIEADLSGTVEKIFVENGTPVEFNTPLFGIRK